MGTQAQSTPKFGVLSYCESNLGDDIQAFAAHQFVPCVDYYVHRDSIGDFATSVPSERVKIILNGWFMGSRSWPPAPSLDPLFVSFHLGRHHYREDTLWGGRDFLLRKKSISYFKEHEPIGCRDLSTLRLLESKQVKGYFSGCLTLTLGPMIKTPISGRLREEILLVDPDVDIRTLFESIPPSLRKSTSFVTHQTALRGPPELRFVTVSKMLQRYANAKFVITSRIHCALPCLAFETPVLFVRPRHDPGRLSGVEELLHIARVSGGTITEMIPWDNPNPNPTKHRHLADQLDTTCRRFMNGVSIG